jgi:tetratricopeptide (TPR) repeat protein
MVSMFLTFYSSGQIPNQTRQSMVDSLLGLLPEARGTYQVDVLNQLATELAPRSFDSSYQYAGEALRLSEELDYPYGKGVAIFNQGNVSFFKTDYKNALVSYLSALRILESFDPTREIADLFLQLAFLNQYVRNIDKAKDYFYRTSGCYLAIGDTARSYSMKFLIGGSYFFKYQTLLRIDPLQQDQANDMMDSALIINKEVLDWVLIHKTWPNFEYVAGLASLNYMNFMYYEAKKDSSAVDYLWKALEYADQISDTLIRNIQTGVVYFNLRHYYYYVVGEKERGYSYALRAIDFYNKTDRIDYYGLALETTGAIDLEEGRFQDAEKHLLMGLSHLDTFLVRVSRSNFVRPRSLRVWDITQAQSFRLDALDNLVLLYQQTGDYKKALEYHKKYEDGKSILTMDNLNREMMGLQAGYEDEIRRQEIAALARDNDLRRMKLNQARITFISAGSFLIIVFLIIMLWIQRKRTKSEHKALILEQRLLRSQMNPHFIFNSLSSIQNFIVTEKPDKASIYLSKFAKLVRNILDNSTEEFVVLEKEISTIENYLELQKVRYAGKFDYQIDIDNDIDIDIVKIPPMLAQPFIENAIEHGIKHRETPGHIDIRFSMKDDTLFFEVEDDGVGRQKAREIEVAQDPGHRSMATSLTHERLANLNRKLHKKIFLEIIDLKNALGEATGTRVVFGVPVGYL